MNGILLAAGAGDDPISAAVREAPIELRVEDSLKSISAPMRKASAAMAGFLVGSVAIHALVLTTAVMANRTSVIPPQQEIAVEIVQDVPKPAAPPKPAKAAQRLVPPATEKPLDPPKIQQAKREQKPEPPKPVPAKSEPPKPEIRKPEATKPAPVEAKAQPVTPPVDAKEIEALQKELSELRAQKAALKTEPQESAQDAAPRGPLAGSLQAIAMPSIGVDGEVAGYQELVFSQLAKAKGDGEYHGQAGTTGVHFEVDAEGHLLHAEIAASSGSAMLDKEALDIVHRAAPFPPPPKDADHTFFANVNFRPPKA